EGWRDDRRVVPNLGTRQRASLQFETNLPSRQLARNSEMFFAFRYRAFIVGLVATITANLTAFAQPAQPEASSTPAASPSATPIFFGDQTLADLKQLQQAALASDYAFKQVAHLANNIGPRLTGSVQAAKAVERSEEHTSELQSLRHLVCR